MMRAIVLVLFLSYGSIKGQYDEEFEEVPSTHQPHILTSESKVEATIGETATFPCEVDDLGDYVLIWKKGKNQILIAGLMKITKDDRINLDGTSLVISNVHPKDSGEYTCQISTIPPLELAHSLDVLYPPTVKPHPKDGFVNVKEGETVSLSCAASGNPKPIIRWKHAGVHYDSSDDTSFRIGSAQKSDSGEYECIADNGVGEPAAAVITVEVVSAPKVYPNPRSGLLTVKEGEPISISCEATGDPVPVITWKRPGGEKSDKLTRDENKIVISEANRNHAGSYECIANNSLGIFTSAIIRVQVQYAPEIKVPHKWSHAGEGSNVNITCIIRGEPIPSVQWKKGEGEIIRENDHYHMKTDGHLHMLEIRHLKEEDFGRYECVASNSLSSVSEDLHIIGTPQIPHFTSKAHGSQGTRYTVAWFVDSHTAVDEYQLMFRKKANNEKQWEIKTIPASDKKEGNTHIQMFQLTNLEPATSYEAVVTARNKFGWSKQSEHLVFTTKKEELVVHYISATESTNSSAQTGPTSAQTSAGAEPAEGTTDIPIDIGHDIPIINDKQTESALSSSATIYINLMLTIPVVFVSMYRNLL